MDVLILAGGKCSPELQRLSGVETRAMLPIHGRPIVELIADRLSSFGDLVMVGGPTTHSWKSVEPGGNFIESLERGLQAVSTESFLLSTGDLPYITEESVSDFISRADPSALLNYPIVHLQACNLKYPGMKRTTIKLREGCFTGGNIALANSSLMRRALPMIGNAYAMRKSPSRLAKLVGLGTLFRVLLGQSLPSSLPLATLEARVSRLLEAPVKAIITEYAELGADIDTAAQYQAFLATTENIRLDR